jgi:hypothetical protein
VKIFDTSASLLLVLLVEFKVVSMALDFTPNAVIAYEFVAPVAVFPLTVAPNEANPLVLLVT